MNLPAFWPRMSAYAKQCYLVNTHQARDFSDAGRKLSQLRRPRAAVQPNHQPQAIRLPYKDEL